MKRIFLISSTLFFIVFLTLIIMIDVKIDDASNSLKELKRTTNINNVNLKLLIKNTDSIDNIKTNYFKK
jgi:hypothetical protein